MERCPTCHSEIGRSQGNCVVCGKPACSGCAGQQFSHKKTHMVAVHHGCRDEFLVWDGREPAKTEEAPAPKPAE